MKRYKYEAKNGTDFVRGVLTANSKEEALDKIGEMGFVPVELFEQRPDGKKNSLFQLKDPLTVKAARVKRVRGHIPVHFCVLEYKGDKFSPEEGIRKLSLFEFQGSMVNISAGGILFATSGQFAAIENTEGDTPVSFSLEDILEPGNVLSLEIGLPDQREPVACSGEILRAMKRQVAHNDEVSFVYHVAIIFTSMSDESRNGIDQFFQSRFASDETV